MTPERIHDQPNSGESASVRRRRSHRHHKSSFYRTWMRPYRRELKSFFLFCAVVIVAYMLWTMLAAH